MLMHALSRYITIPTKKLKRRTYIERGSVGVAKQQVGDGVGVPENITSVFRFATMGQEPASSETTGQSSE